MNAKTLLLRIAACFIIGSLFIIQACDDDDEAPDSQSPEMSFTYLTENMTVWNTVSVEFTASDNKGISQIDFFVGGNLVSSTTTEPFVFEWDSNTVPDGDHTIRITVSDKAGNSITTDVTLKVANNLITIAIGANQLNTDPGDAERGFVFLSDSTGKVIASQEYHNGETIALKSSSFNGDKFYVTEVLREDKEGGTENFVRAWTYASIERGKNWVVLDDRDEEDETYAGEVNPVFINATPGFYYHGVTNGDDLNYDDFGHTESVRLRKNPSSLYLIRYANDNGGTSPLPDPTFHLTQLSLTNGSVNLAQVTRQLTKVITDFPDDIIYSSINIDAYLGITPDYKEPYHIGYYGSPASEYPYYFPGPGSGGTFPHFYVEMDYETPDLYYRRGSKSTAFAIPGIANDVDFTFSGGKLSYTATGAFDAVSTQFESGDEDAYWSIILPASSTVTTLPSFQLPQVLQGFDLPSFSLPSHFTVYDWEEISDYKDLKEYIRASTLSVDGLYEEGKNYVDIEYNSSSTGGRLKKSKAPRTFGKSLK